MQLYLTKKALYEQVDKLKIKLDLKAAEFPINALDLAYKYCVNLEVQYLEFEKLCAILHKSPTTTTLALNKLRSPFSQNFDCMHELIHYFLHDNQSAFNCMDFDGFKQNGYLEWQANEGAAQALVPYQEFIPLYVKIAIENKNEFYLYKIINSLASHFHVTEHVINNRIRSLQYEIYQYFTLNTPIKDLKILSHSKQQKYKLDSLKAEKKYCLKCCSIIEKNESFCKVCGRALNIFNHREGLGYMKYSEIKIDPHNSKALVCPICENENYQSEGDYCHICGKHIRNFCTNCEKLLSGDARYCPDCGAISTFCKNGILLKWNNNNTDCLEELSENSVENIVLNDNDLPF